MKDLLKYAFPNPDLNDAGMTLRDWFAGMALQGMCASARDGKHNIDMCDVVAMAAYKYADAMIKERGK